MFLDVLKERVLIFDGAMGTMVQRLNLASLCYGGEDFKMLTDLISISSPQKIKEIHKSFLIAGANIIETNSFGASFLRLAEFDFKNINVDEFEILPHEFKINDNDYRNLSILLSRVSAENARSALEEYKKSVEYDGKPLFVAGSLGPSNRLLSSTKAALRKASFDEIEENFYVQCRALIEGGVDILLFETGQDPLEIKAAILGGKRALKDLNKQLPIIAQVAVDKNGRMPIFNTSLHSVYVTLEGIGINVFGTNCNLTPDKMYSPLLEIDGFCNHYISALPNAGEPENINGEISYTLKEKDFANWGEKYVIECGVNIVGGCCGTTPEHIKLLAEKVRNIKPKKRKKHNRVYISGPQEAVEIKKTNLDIIKIGERINVRGSKKTRDAIEKKAKIDFETLNEILVEQNRDLGLLILDVCMDSNLVDTPKVLSEVIYRLTSDLNGAFCIDSFSPEALEEALKVYPGRPIINSISLEEFTPGKTKLDMVLEKTRHHNPMYIALTAGPQGPARSADEKFKIAQEVIKICRDNYCVEARNIFIDIGAFPIGTESSDEENFALESLKSIPLIKSIDPNIKTIIGISNLTSGLNKKNYMKILLISCFLNEAIKRGLDAAIINPNFYVPIQSLDYKDMLLAKKIILEKDMDAYFFLELLSQNKSGESRVNQKKIAYDQMPAVPRVCQKIKDGYKKNENGSLNIDNSVFNYTDTIILDVFEAIKNIAPFEFINDHLSKLMQALGDSYSSGELSLPQLLKSADLMKQVMNFLEFIIKRSSGGQIKTKGKVVLGTVWQDIHTIGKDLVKTLLENYGYEVVDLGTQVKNEDFLKEARKDGVVAIGLSALLVQTANHMKEISDLLVVNGINLPILIGGAAVNLKHAAYVAGVSDKNNEIINKSVFYCKNAMDAISILAELENFEEIEKILNQNREKLLNAHGKKLKDKKDYDHIEVSFLDYEPNLKNTGIYDLNISVREISKYISIKNLFLKNWKFKTKEFEGMNSNQKNKHLNLWINKCIDNNWLTLYFRYGIFPVKSQEDSLIFFDPLNFNKSLGRLEFDVISLDKTKFSPARYFLPAKRDVFDVASIFISSVKINWVNDKSFYIETNFMVQALADRISEDLAEYGHEYIKKNQGIHGKVGKRFSPGYPSISDLKNNKTIYDLLKASDLGISLTGGNIFSPTSTTCAVICFNPHI